MMRYLKSQLFWLVLGILSASALILWPLAKPGLIVTDDGDWMVIRLSAFFQSLREGQFPVRFLGRLNFSYGYPVANFLYPAFLYIGSFIHLFGISFPDTIKLIFAGSIVISALLIFLWLRKHFSEIPSFFGTLNFIFAPYLLFDLYKRGSVGEVLSLVPAALSFYSIDSKKYWLLPFAVGLLITSHNSLALIFLIVIMVYIFLKGSLSLFIPVLLGIGLATFFWFPAIFERQYVIFDQVAVSDPLQYFIEGAAIMLLGLANLAAGFLLLVRGNKLGRPQFIYYISIFVFSVLISMPISGLLWQNKIFSHLFQFPYRFLALGFFAGSWLVAYTVELYAQKHVGKLAVLFVFFWIVPLVPLLNSVKSIDRPIGFYTTNEATTTVQDEYMPRWITEKPTSRAGQKMVIIIGNGEILQKTYSTQHIEATVHTEDANSIMQINTIYYPGWGVMVDNQPEKFTFNNSLGVIRFHLPKGTHQVVAEFRETPTRFLADMISLVCGILTVAYIFFLKHKTSAKTEKYLHIKHT